MFNITCACRAEELSSKLREKAKNISGAQSVKLQNAAKILLSDVQNALNVPIEKKDGKIIRSLAGEPPRKDSGLLRESIFSSVVSSGAKARFRVGIKGRAALYAKYLEYGSSKMAARPFLIPALQKQKQLLSAEMRSQKFL